MLQNNAGLNVGGRTVSVVLRTHVGGACMHSLAAGFLLLFYLEITSEELLRAAASTGASDHRVHLELRPTRAGLKGPEPEWLRNKSTACIFESEQEKCAVFTQNYFFRFLFSSEANRNQMFSPDLSLAPPSPLTPPPR